MRAAAGLLAAAPAAAVDTFTLYTEGMALRPGEVHNNPVRPIPLPDRIKQKYAGKSMGVVKFQFDIVRLAGHGTDAEARIPLSEIYDHHTVQAMGTNDTIWGNYARWQQEDPLIPPGWPIGPPPPPPPGGVRPRRSRQMHCGSVQGSPRPGEMWMGPVGGAEFRDADRDLPLPYRAIVDSPEAFSAIVHVINIKDAAQEGDWPRIYECPCTSLRNITEKGPVITIDGVTPIPFMCTLELDRQKNSGCGYGYKGGYRCCEHGAWLTEKPQVDAPKTEFVGKFTFTIDDVQPQTRHAFFHQIDVSGSNAEYDVPKCTAAPVHGSQAEACVHTITSARPMFSNLVTFANNMSGWPSGWHPKADGWNPEVELLTARGHQHVGGLGMELYNEQTGQLLCSATPRFGTGAVDEVGNEGGFLVGIEPCVWGPPPLQPPPRLRALDLLRTVSRYNSTEAHYGVMGFWFTQMSIVPDTGGRVGPNN